MLEISTIIADAARYREAWQTTVLPTTWLKVGTLNALVGSDYPLDIYNNLTSLSS